MGELIYAAWNALWPKGSCSTGELAGMGGGGGGGGETTSECTSAAGGQRLSACDTTTYGLVRRLGRHVELLEDQAVAQCVVVDHVYEGRGGLVVLALHVTRRGEVGVVL